MTPINLTLAGVRAAAKKAYDEGRLLAQNPQWGQDGTPEYGYCVGGFVCAVGAAMADPTQIPSEQQIERVFNLRYRRIVNLADSEVTLVGHIQGAHDRWLRAVGDGVGAEILEREFLELVS